jgi:NADPH2:quinone reductase
MKALRSHLPGLDLSLDDVPEPTAGSGELLVTVRACALNFPDVLMMQDLYQVRPPRPFAPGGEIAGTVKAVGPDTAGFSIGDRVIACPGLGGLVENALVKASVCVPMPASLPFAEGAALMTTYGTSYHALKQRAELKAGERLLVLGAAGGVGIAAVQLGRAMGAEVIAAVSTEAKAEFARSQGASSSIVYPTDVDAKDLSSAFRAALGPRGVDVVYDAVGGAYTEAALRCCAWRGRVLIVGFPAGIPTVATNLALLKGAALLGVFYGRFVQEEPKAALANTQELFDLIQRGAITPIISKRYAIEDAAAGMRELSERTAVGKIVVYLNNTGAE